MKQRICSLLLAMALVFVPCVQAQAVTSVNLDGSGTTAVPGTTSTGNFSVTLSQSSDTLTVYKLAAATWNADTETYTAEWTAPIKAWVTTGAGASKYKNYGTPTLLAEAAQTVIDAFYKDLQAAIAANPSTYSTILVDASKGQQAAGTATWNFTDMDLGQYFAMGKASGATSYYAPITINLVPERSAGGDWIIVAKQVKLKFGSTSVEKTISDDTVGVGDVVDFTISAGIPNYTQSMNSQKKIFIIDDDMNPAFSYIDGTLKVTAENEDGTEEELPSDYYSAVISSEVTIYTCPTRSHQYFNIYMVEQEGIKYFYFLKNGVMNLLYSTSNVTSSTLSYSGPVFKAYQSLTGDRILHGLRAKNESKNIFNINFDYEKLAEAGYTDVRVEYSAMVTDEVQIGTDGNTNTAYLWYAKDEQGNTGSSEDTVTAWSYGAHLIKVDGDTLTNGEIGAGTKYLAGAAFILYEQVKTYTGATLEGNQEYEKDLENYQRQGATRTIPVYDENGAIVTGYELYAESRKDITSTATSAGVSIDGLHPGIYLLEETLAPQGYNLLAQALKFSITVPDAEPGQEGKRDSQTAFTDDENKKHDNGYYDLIVQNFKGLLLPNTGGMGTTVMTMAGFMLMMAALVMILLKVRKGQYKN